MKPTLFIMTGGTIDAEAYETTPPDVTPLERSLVPDTVRALFPEAGDALRFVQWQPMLDSKYIDGEKLDLLARQIHDAPEKRVVVTCGTDWMAQHAEAVQQRLRRMEAEQPQGRTRRHEPGKTVIFTGAMQPLLHGPEHSDGEQNLRAALLRMSLLEAQRPASNQGSDVFLVGREERIEGVHYTPGLFRAGQVEKDFERKVFRRTGQETGVEVVRA